MSHLIHREPFEDLMRGFFVRPTESKRHQRGQAARIRVDIHESSEQYRVLAELPGITKEAIDIQIDGPIVAITAERTPSAEALPEGTRVLHSERFVGKLSRSFQLPQEVDESAASARFVEGVLELTLPKKAPSQARRISIA